MKVLRPIHQDVVYCFAANKHCHANIACGRRKKVADIIARGLKAEPFAVDVCHSGQSGWESANTYHDDLMTLDLMPPRLTTMEILPKVRLNNSQDPILFPTAPQSFQGLTNIVDVYVRHLREKLDDTHPVKLLSTVRGVGYSLNDGSQP
jgi:DNA-binding response OmpR family regulator